MKTTNPAARIIGASAALHLAVAAISICTFANRAMAANPSGDLRIEVIAAYNLVVDSNIGSGSSSSPESAYLGALFHNDGTTDLHNVFAYIGNFVNGTNDTPGVYPTRTNPSPLVGTLSLTHYGGTAGTADAIRYFGTIPAGESVTAYWLVGYPLTDTNGTPTFGTSVKPDDDLWLEYDVWATAVDATNGNLLATVTRDLTMRSEISSSANKIIPNSANKVPQEYLDLLGIYAPSWTNAAANGSVGTSITVEGYWYDMGVVSGGFDNDGDGVPDNNIWMQPVGIPSYFDPSCLRLVRTHALVVVKLKDGTDLAYVADDQLYFEHIPDNNGVVGLVIYDFLPVKAGCSSQLTPYQEAASGNDNEKFNCDFGTVLGGVLTTLSAGNVELTKTASTAIAYPGSNIAYSISFTNNGSLSLGNAERGVPLVIGDRIPTGTFYVAASATNNNTLPAGITSYTTLFSTNYGGAWSTAEPVPATNVTDIQWWLTGPLSAGATGVVRFTVTVLTSYSNGSPIIVNTAGASFGSTTPFTNATANTFIIGTNKIASAVFYDEGAGSFFGNGAKDTGEGGIPNITVKLYYDANANGVQDSFDVFVASTNSDSSGNYVFASLLDGRFVVVLDTSDPDIPYGYTATTSTYFSVSLDPTSTNPAMVTYTSANFGFASSLGLSKSGLSWTREGSNITYTISITNTLPSTAVYMTYTVWATNAAMKTGAKWVNPANAGTPPYPDGANATLLVASPSDELNISGHNTNAQAGTITKVEMRIPMTVTGPFGAANDTLTIALCTNGVGAGTVYSEIRTLTNYYNDLVTQFTNGYYVINVTTSKTWVWTDFTLGNKLVIQVIGDKVGSDQSDGTTIAVDQAGFRITTDQPATSTSNSPTTLNPVPVTDIYDADMLRYVSASPPPTASTTNGTAPNTIGRLYWANVGPIIAGAGQTITVTYTALEPPGNILAETTNVVVITNATYATGIPANIKTGTAATVIAPAGTIGDRVWRDVNSNDVEDAGDIGIPNVAVIITPPSSLIDLGSGGGKPVTNYTDSNGYYLFRGIPADGMYTVRVDTATLPTGGGTFTNVWDMDNILEATGNHNNTNIVDMNFDATDGSDTRLDADFGYRFQFVTIEGNLWVDWDRSGTSTPDSGEEGLTNVTVYLFTNLVPGAYNTAVATNRTTNGYFRFVGTYTNYCVLVVTNSGAMTNISWAQTYDTDGLASSNYVAGTASPGGVYRADFSYSKVGTYNLGGYVYFDWDGDGTRDPTEEGLTNITVRLYQDENTNGVINTGVDAFIKSTDVGGTYLFTNLAAGNYILVVDQNDPDFPLNVLCSQDPYGAYDGVSLVTITTSSVTNQEFGYMPYGVASVGDTVWRDMDGNGTQSGLSETGISNIMVTLLSDLNLDGIYSPMASNNTSATGYYMFQSLPAGNYRVQVSTNDTDLPVDAFGALYRTPTNIVTLTLTNYESRTDVDFGFAPRAAVGDLVYWDANTNGTRDWNENGVTGTLVSIYYDLNTNGVYDLTDGSAVAVTNTDSAGRYIFSNLATGWYVIVVDTNSLQLVGKEITGDPDAGSIIPGRDRDAQYGVTLSFGTVLLGVDFGFKPKGIIGDRLWIDSNNNKTQDVGEVGIAYVTVGLFTNGGAVAVATNVTDSDGYYTFSGVQDGTYNVIVYTNDPDFVSQFEPTYNADVAAGGVLDNCATNVEVYLGSVTNVNSVVWTNGDLAIDFGFRFAGTNVLMGTIGLDTNVPPDGVLGSGTNGVGAGEFAYSNVTVYLDFWIDKDGDFRRDPGEVFTIGTASSATNGDYVFSGLPSSVGVSNYYVVSVIAPDAELGLATTTTASSVVSNFLDSSGYTASALQIVPVPGSGTATNIDFAFTSMAAHDYGDLPDTYGTTMPNAARHKVKPSPTLYLGFTVDTENDGVPTVGATGDGADEDGVFPQGAWHAGTGGGQVQTKVVGSGYLVAFIDFGTNGTFAGDLVITQAVTAGYVTNTFTIPAGGISTNVTSLYARFRLYDVAPATPALGYVGTANDGEVEDYYWQFGAVGNRLWNDLNSNGVVETGEAGIPGVRVFVDEDGDGLYDAGEPYGTTDTNGVYHIGGLCTGLYSIAVDTTTVVGGSVPVYDYDGTTTPHRASIDVTSAQVYTNVLFGYLLPRTDLRVDKTASGAGRVATNGVVSFTIVVTNNGPSAATSIRIQDVWPSQIIFSNYWASAGTYNSASGVWSNFSLSVGATATLVITGRVNTTQQYQSLTNRAYLASLDQYDTNTGNDQSDAVVSTLIVLSRVSAFVGDHGGWVEWETSSEIGTAGFNVYRVKEREKRVRVNESVVPAAVDAPQGAVYRLPEDKMRPGGVYTYLIEELEQQGMTREYGPFTVVASATGDPSPAVADSAARRNPVVRAKAGPAEDPAAPGLKVLAFEGFVPPALRPVKLAVKAAGAYRVNAVEVAAATGCDPTFVAMSFASATVRLGNRGRTIPFLSEGDGSAIYFHGEAIESAYTDANAYWLTWEPGVAMESTDILPGDGALLTTFRETAHFEQERYAATAVIREPDGDYWLWEYLQAGNALTGKRTFFLRADGVAAGGGSASLRVRMLGATTIGRGRDHHVVVRLNGTAIGEQAWAGIGIREMAFAFDQALLVDGDNTVEITALLDPLVQYSTVYLDSFDLSYVRRLAAVCDRLAFRTLPAGTVAVDGFSAPGLKVFDISVPAAPKVVAGVSIEEAGGGFRAVFGSAATNAAYELFTPASAMPVAAMTARAEPDLGSAANEGRYLIVTVPWLAGPAGRLAEYRRSRGLPSKVIMVEDAYDQFGYGIADPRALRAFLAHALETWRVPPRYVLLAGEGTYDYKGYKMTGDNMVPPFLAVTQSGMFPSDAPYADPNGDGVLDMAVGRLPVATAAEFDAVIDKIIAYESAAPAEWQTVATLAADVPDKGGDFTASSEAAAGLVPEGWSQVKVNLAEMTVAAARASLIGRINDGTAFLNFIGHGGMDTLSSRGLLKTVDVAGLSNGSRLTVVTALSCVIGRFDVPGYDSLGEALVLKAGGGAVAVWAPSGLSFNDPAAALGRAFYRAVIQQGEGMLGEAILRAKAEAAAGGCPADYLALYNLICDPATAIAGFDAAYGGERPSGISLAEWKRMGFTWADRQDTAVSGDDADPDGDGVQNLAEYAFGRNPRGADMGSLFDLAREAGDPAYDFEVQFSRNRQAVDTEIAVEISGDLVTWQGGSAYVSGIRVTDDGNGLTETVRVMVRTPDPEKRKGFVRVRVWKR
jgi:uncharacterized repeat protein (TIGR01451 family)